MFYLFLIIHTLPRKKMIILDIIRSIKPQYRGLRNVLINNLPCHLSKLCLFCIYECLFSIKHLLDIETLTLGINHHIRNKDPLRLFIFILHSASEPSSIKLICSYFTHLEINRVTIIIKSGSLKIENTFSLKIHTNT